MRSFRPIPALLMVGSLGLLRCGHLGIELDDGGASASGGRASGGTETSGGANGSGGKGEPGDGGAPSGGSGNGGGGSTTGGGAATGGATGVGGDPPTGGTSSGGALIYEVSIPGGLPEPPGPETAGAAGAAGAPGTAEPCVENCPCPASYCHFGCELQSAAATTVCRPNCGEATCFIEQNDVPKVDADCPNGECYVLAGDGLSELDLRNHGQYTVDCTAASACGVLCQGGSNCDVFCGSGDPSQGCRMTCEGQSTCTLIGSPSPASDLTCTDTQKYICENGARCGLKCDVPIGD